MRATPALTACSSSISIQGIGSSPIKERQYVTPSWVLLWPTTTTRCLDLGSRCLPLSHDVGLPAQPHAKHRHEDEHRPEREAEQPAARAQGHRLSSPAFGLLRACPNNEFAGQC